MNQEFKHMIIGIAFGILLMTIYFYQLKIDKLYTSIRIKDNLIWLYEHPGDVKGVKPHLRKDGSIR